MQDHELIWGLTEVAYYFLGGLGAGALITSASMLLRGGPDQRYFQFARYGALLAVPIVAIGAGLLVLELGSFQAGHWFRWLNLYKVVTLSPMSIGSWLLMVFMLVATPYALLFLVKGTGPDDRYQGMRRKLAWVGIPLGIGVAVYTGILLGAMPSRPLWNSPILALLFLLSAITCGIAAVLLVDWLVGVFGSGYLTTTQQKARVESGYLLTTTLALLLAFEVLIVFLFFMYAHITIGDKKMAIKVFEFGGELFAWFFVGLLLFGLLVPGLIAVKKILPRLLKKEDYKHSGATIFIVPVLVIAGGVLLRYLIVVGGQISRLGGL